MITGSMGQSPKSDREYGFSKATICPWDWSKDPKDNSDREKKLGYGDGTPMGAIAAYDKDNQAITPANGLHGGGIKISSIWNLDPDHWTPRLHTARGREVDNVWAPRDVVEHENNDYERAHRSDMVINQKTRMVWAFKRDQWRVIGLGASVSDEELGYDDAGFLRMLRSKDVATGGMTRGCLALSIEKRGGHYADANLAAQLWHILTMKAKGGGGTQTADDGIDVSEANGALRGDVNFMLGNDLGHLAFAYAYETSGYIWSGKHWLHTPAPLPPAYEPSTDGNSNQKKIDRNLEKGIWVYILKPPENVPTYGIPPLREFPPPAGASVVDTKSLPSGPGGNAGGFTYGNFPAGLNTDEPLYLPIPEVGGPTDLRVLISWKPSTPLAGGDVIELALVYKVVPASGAIPAVPLMVTKQLTPADNPASDLGLIDWTIPNVLLGNMKGGFIAMEFFRRGREASDTFAGVFKQAGGARVHFRPRPMNPVGA